MNRAVCGTLAVQDSGRPLVGWQVVAARILPGAWAPGGVLGSGVDVLGGSVSTEMGSFRVTYDPLPEPTDILLFIYRPDGQLAYTEPVHRCIAGAELLLHIQVPSAAVAADMVP